jgi:two-component system, NtrC family, sensor kinase
MMAKKIIHVIFLIGMHAVCLSQNKPLHDSTGGTKLNNLMQQLSRAKDDSSRIFALDRIGFFYQGLNVDSSLKYFNAALDLAKQKAYPWAEARVMAGLSGLMEHQGKYAEAFELLFKSLKIAEENNLGYDIARANRRISGVYFELQNYPKAIAYLLKALQIDQANHHPDKVAIDRYALADAYEKINKLDSASLHIDFALTQKDLLKGLIQYVYEIDGHIQQKKGNYDQAIISYQEGFEEAQKSSDLVSSSQICADFSALYMRRNMRDSAIIYALQGFNYGKEISFQKGIMLNGYLLTELYDSIEPAVALKYFKMASAAENRLYGVNNIQTIQNLIAREDAKRKELEDAKTAYRNKLRLFGLLTGLAVLLIVAFLLYRNNRHKQKVNKQLEQQKEALQKTLSELKSTQAQLIQSEKMASLGELTAGIAHEIQNPLNFVNNFSEVSNELMDEMNDELNKGDIGEAKIIATDIKQNLEKINHHGKRADAIVKGMLQHSRTSSGQKEPSDINALCDEYLRLAYHGMQAKDKSFNAKFETDFDNTIGNVNAVPQNIGRVVLNFINNAFYAVNEKAKQNIMGYEPTVIVSTKKINGKVEINVKDNGNGIPDSIKEKIFQPFFTTKPTGSGTGLGLSLSYDIVKAHGGEIKLNSRENEGAEFIIQLPVV